MFQFQLSLLFNLRFCKKMRDVVMTLLNWLFEIELLLLLYPLIFNNVKLEFILHGVKIKNPYESFLNELVKFVEIGVKL